MIMKRNCTFDFDSMFDSLFYNFPTESKPPLDKRFVYGDDNEVKETLFQVALAGYTKEDIKVWVEGREIHIEGSNANNAEVLPKFRSSFAWKIPVGEDVSLKDTKTSFKDGLLTIRIPIRKPEVVKTFLMGRE